MANWTEMKKLSKPIIVPILTGKASRKALSFILVTNCHMVFMSLTETNSLFIKGKMFAKIPSLHTDPIYVAPKIIDLIAQTSFPWYGKQHLIGTENSIADITTTHEVF